MISRVEVGINLGAIRSKRKMSKKDVCKAIGVSTATLYNWESGLVSPSLASMVKLAELYGCSLDELAGRDTKAPPSHA